MGALCNSLCFKRLLELYFHEQAYDRIGFTQHHSSVGVDVLFSFRLQGSFKPNEIFCAPLLFMVDFGKLPKYLCRNLQLNENIQPAQKTKTTDFY